VNDALAETRISLLAPLKQPSKKRILEIDILRAIAILLVVLYHIPHATVADVSPALGLQASPVDILGTVGLSMFFFVSGLSLYLNDKSINNKRDALSFYKKRAVRIYPLYWLFVVGIVIVHMPTLGQTIIYITGLQALFYPIFISVPIYHFISAILIFYLLFPLIVFFDSYKKMLLVSLIPLLFFAAILLLFGLSDTMFMAYYGVFIGGIIAGKLNVYGQMRHVKSKRFFVLTLALSLALLSLWPIVSDLPSSFVSSVFLGYFFYTAVVLVIMFWAMLYVEVFKTKFYAFFTFVAFSTYGVFLLNTPFYTWLGASLNTKFHTSGTVTDVICVALIPLLVIAGYLLQLIANEIVKFPKARQSQ
jgi:peptidoglycan/LPS O-acetylase OafA/YrhL